MTIEQKSELNRFVDPSIIEPLQFRWRWLKLFLPIWLYGLAFFFELGLFMSWLANKPLLESLAISLGPLLAIFLFLTILKEIGIRLGHRANRVIQFQDDQIILGPGKNPRIQWKDVFKFQFEPVAESPGLTKLILTSLRPRKKPRRVQDTIVIENPSLAHELIDNLQKRKAETSTNYEIVVLDSSSLPPAMPAFLFCGMSIFFSGIFLLSHGVPMLLALLNPSHHDPDKDSKLSPEEIAKLNHFILKHFSSKEEFHHFFLMLGSGLTIAGCILLFWGWWLMNRKTHAAPTLTAASRNWKS